MYNRISIFLFVFVMSILLVAGQARSATHEGDVSDAEFALTIGAQTGPFDTGTGFFISGEIGLPLFELEHGRILGLVNIGFGQTDDDITFEPTINIPNPGLIDTQNSVDLSTLSIILGLKYKLLMHKIIQPFVYGGPGFNVFLNDSNPGDLPGGIAPQAPDLEDQGFPSGQGNVELGLHLGGGVDFNITEKIFAGAEARFNWVDRTNGSWGTYGVRAGFRF